MRGVGEWGYRRCYGTVLSDDENVSGNQKKDV